jgi:phosphatidylinositol phospholipase C gamma-1
MVSLNYQTPDKAMQVNQGKFRQNGKCGYVLRPDFMFQPDEDSLMVTPLESITIGVVVLGARHLSKSGRGIVSPFVEIEVIGNSSESRKTKTVQDNGLCPYWNDSFDFQIVCPELVMIRFVVVRLTNLNSSFI